MFRTIYNYIFRAESSRLKVVIKKIEALFHKDPLNFDELKIGENFRRREKDRQLELLNKTADQIYEEEVERAKKIKKHLRRIIDKYNIKVD